MKKRLEPALIILGLLVLLLGWPALVGFLTRETPHILPEASAAPPSSASVTYYARLVITDQWGNERTVKNGSGSGVTLACNEAPEFNYQLNNEKVTVWDATGSWTSFSSLYMESDGQLDIEFTCNNGASEQLSVIRLEANAPLILWADDSYHTAVGGDLFAGTLDVIDLIRAYESASTNVHLRVVLTR